MAESLESAVTPATRRRLWSYAVASAHRGYWDECEKVLLPLMQFVDMRADVMCATAFMTWRRTHAPQAAGQLEAYARQGSAVARLLLGHVHLDASLPLPAIQALQSVLGSPDPSAREMAVYLERRLAHHLQHSPLPT